MGASIRKITSRDNIAVAQIIRTVMPEFGAGGQATPVIFACDTFYLLKLN
jgi:hypothetical protein